MVQFERVACRSNYDRGTTRRVQTTTREDERQRQEVDRGFGTQVFIDEVQHYEDIFEGFGDFGSVARQLRRYIEKGESD